MKNRAITSRDVDFAKWYTDIVKEAKLADYSAVKGFVILDANGYAIWEMIQKTLDKMFKNSGHENVYLPLLMPESLLAKEAELVEGFAPEVAWVTQGGNKKLEERLCIRPTSETLFGEYYSSIVKSYRDLPLLYNQWCSVVRWEKETRPFLRTREFLWQEGHTVHETSNEAEEETMKMLKIYQKFFEEYLAIPVLIGKKTEKEKFAGAEYTLTVEALMYNGVALQSATSHYFGNKFAKAYDIKFSNRENKLEYAYQTSWGASSRMIGGLIMVHSDDNGLVLPPKIAPTQVMVVPIQNSDKVIEVANNLKNKLSKFSIKIDSSDKSPGFKFAEAEVRGIPLRIEIGERDLEKGEVSLVRRDTRERINISLDKITEGEIESTLEKIQTNLYNKAKAREEALTFEAQNLDEMKAIIEKQPGFIKAMWCGDPACEEKIKEIGGLKARCLPFEKEEVSKTCVCCSKEAKEYVVWGIQY